MTSNELKDLFRLEMSDQVEPFFWSDTEVYQYIDDAQKMFCRLTDGISDASTAAVVSIEVSAGATWLDLHPAILKIRGARRGSDGAELTLLNYEELAERGLRLDARSGPLRLVITGMEEDRLRLVEAAAVDDSIQLLVFRLPLEDITDDEQDLEIGAQHHMHLLYWVKRCALLKQDAETFDKLKAAEMEDIFRVYCEKVKREQGMKRHKGARTVAYGGL